jgi:hypothetical protein
MVRLIGADMPGKDPSAYPLAQSLTCTVIVLYFSARAESKRFGQGAADFVRAAAELKKSLRSPYIVRSRYPRLAKARHRVKAWRRFHNCRGVYRSLHVGLLLNTTNWVSVSGGTE